MDGGVNYSGAATGGVALASTTACVHHRHLGLPQENLERGLGLRAIFFSPGFDSGGVLVDAWIEERVWFEFFSSFCQSVRIK